MPLRTGLRDPTRGWGPGEGGAGRPAPITAASPLEWGACIPMKDSWPSGGWLGAGRLVFGKQPCSHWCGLKSMAWMVVARRGKPGPHKQAWGACPSLRTPASVGEPPCTSVAAGTSEAPLNSQHASLGPAGLCSVGMTRSSGLESSLALDNRLGHCWMARRGHRDVSPTHLPAQACTLVHTRQAGLPPRRVGLGPLKGCGHGEPAPAPRSEEGRPCLTDVIHRSPGAGVGAAASPGPDPSLSAPQTVGAAPYSGGLERQRGHRESL